MSSEFASMQSFAISSGVVRSGFATVFSGSFGRVGERAGDIARIGGHALQGTGAVEMLGAANEPDFGSGQVDHERPAWVFAFGPWNRSRRGSVGWRDERLGISFRPAARI